MFTESGGYEVARTEERMEELRRRMSSARAWGVPAELVDAGPRRRARPVPGEGQDPRRVLVPVGRRGRLAARGHAVPRVRAGARRAHRGVDRRGGRHGRRAGPDPAGAHHRRRHRGRDRRDRLRRVEPEAGEDGGRVDPAHPRRAPDDLGGADPAARRAAGRDLVPDRPRHGHVLLRAPARRRHGGGLLRPPRRSSYDADEIPSIEQSKLSPTELPFTADDFDPQLEQAFELMPDALGADGAEIRYAINGLLSLTPDGGPLLGETPEVKGLWSAAAVWIKEGPGVGRAVAEWMTHGHSEIDVHHSDIARFYPHQRTRALRAGPHVEAFNKTYGIVHPGEQWAGERGKRARADARGRGGGRRGVLRDRRLGAAVLVRVQRGPARRVRRPGAAARARVGLPLVVADHQRRAPRDARAAPASSTCPRSRSSTSSGRPRRRPCRASSSRRPTWPTAG